MAIKHLIVQTKINDLHKLNERPFLRLHNIKGVWDTYSGPIYERIVIFYMPRSQKRWDELVVTPQIIVCGVTTKNPKS